MKRSLSNVALLVLSTASSCGGLTDLGAGSSGFLAECAGDTCGAGLSCICGTCTRPCSARTACADLGSDVVCVDSQTSCSFARVCALRCSTREDCTGDLACVDGACRRIVTSSGTGGSQGTGGSPSTGGWTATGGSPATGGWVASGGATSTGGSPATGGTGGIIEAPPPCLNGQTKGGLCSVEGMSCYKTCGPKSVGWKTETCTTGVFVEGDCMYAQYYPCFDLPDPISECDPSGPVQASQPCYALDCMPCGPDYLDSAGNAKVGYCVCNGGDGTNAGTWSCASATSWPPQ